MKVVILAGGYGTRISEETSLIPKPLIKISGKPILLHIMEHYAFYGHKEFIICCGYKGNKLIQYFQSLLKKTSKSPSIRIKFGEQFSAKKNLKVTLVDTGKDTMTGGRIKRIKKFIDRNELFLMTYGDGLSNVNINKLIELHKLKNTFATVTAVAQPNRFGILKIKNNKATVFEEKPLDADKRINGGFFVLTYDIFKFITNDNTIWEKKPLQKLASIGQLSAYNHNGFWHPMDTLRDKLHLEKLSKQKKTPWKKVS